MMPVSGRNAMIRPPRLHSTTWMRPTIVMVADAAEFVADDTEFAGLVGRDREHHVVAWDEPEC